MLHLAQPLDTSDPLLMSDDERAAFLTPRIRPFLVYRHDTPGTSATGFRGVSQNGRKFQAQIKSNGRNLYLGSFDTPELAAHAYDVKTRELHGEHAILNFPDEWEDAA